MGMKHKENNSRQGCSSRDAGEDIWTQWVSEDEKAEENYIMISFMMLTRQQILLG